MSTACVVVSVSEHICDRNHAGNVGLLSMPLVSFDSDLLPLMTPATAKIQKGENPERFSTQHERPVLRGRTGTHRRIMRSSLRLQARAPPLPGAWVRAVRGEAGKQAIAPSFGGYSTNTLICAAVSTWRYIIKQIWYPLGNLTSL